MYFPDRPGRQDHDIDRPIPEVMGIAGPDTGKITWRIHDRFAITGTDHTNGLALREYGILQPPADRLRESIPLTDNMDIPAGVFIHISRHKNDGKRDRASKVIEGFHFRKHLRKADGVDHNGTKK